MPKMYRLKAGATCVDAASQYEEKILNKTSKHKVKSYAWWLCKLQRYTLEQPPLLIFEQLQCHLRYAHRGCGPWEHFIFTKKNCRVRNCCQNFKIKCKTLSISTNLATMGSN